jgi:hypothetical protein
MKGIYNEKSHAAKYDSIWDVETVLLHLKSIENASLSLCALASKLATLLAPATLFRASDLASVNLKSVVFTGNRISLSLSKPLQAQEIRVTAELFIGKTG